MSKALLVIDMPESCDMCDFVDDKQPPRYGEKTLYCNVPGIGEDVTDYVTCRPDFCPLRELPKKKRTIGNENEESILMMNMGWNACLDEITR